MDIKEIENKLNLNKKWNVRLKIVDKKDIAWKDTVLSFDGSDILTVGKKDSGYISTRDYCLFGTMFPGLEYNQKTGLNLHWNKAIQVLFPRYYQGEFKGHVARR